MNTEEMTNRMQDWQKRASETAKNASSAADRYVRENTWATIGVAALLGCIVGYLLSARRD